MKNLPMISLILIIIFLMPCQTQEVATSLPFPEAGKVRIIRDTYGLPHIFAANEPDAMYGLGYATAEDRLEQIFTTMFTAEGRLSELTGGKNNFQSDVLFRSFRFKQRADKLLNEMKPELRALAVHYCRGINDYIREHREKSRIGSLVPSRATWHP